MENRIDVALSEETKQKILDGIAAVKTLMPFLLKISDTERKSMQLLDDGRRPFVEKSIDLAGRNASISPGPEFLAACQRDFVTYSTLSAIENELMQLLEMVHDTKQLAGAEAYEVSRFIYMELVFQKLEKYIVQEYGIDPAEEATTPPCGHPSTGGETGSFAPIDLLDYIYGVLHSPTYREKYKEFLKIDFPRVPYPTIGTFWQLVRLGGELRQIHLLESPVVERYITQYPMVAPACTFGFSNSYRSICTCPLMLLYKALNWSIPSSRFSTKGSK